MSTTTTKRHPIRGILWGILMGIGLAITAVGMKWAAIGTNGPFVFFGIGLVISVAWSLFGPAKAPKGPPPAAEPEADPAPDAPDSPDTVVVVEEMTVVTDGAELPGADAADETADEAADESTEVDTEA
ncbi:MAG: hypothetical protein R8F63_04840 [Acidimicrobiales bacterium]|nr:hypothetical protein [Acidimicrobiales bacterium]